jgi:hypothetical protein
MHFNVLKYHKLLTIKYFYKKIELQDYSIPLFIHNTKILISEDFL